MSRSPARGRALLAVGATLALAGCGGAQAAGGDPGAAARAATAPFAGVAQSGNTLGDPDADAVGALFVDAADIDAYLDRRVVPALVERYVRTGRLALRLRTVTTGDDLLGEDSGPATRVLQGVGLERPRLWQAFFAYRAAALRAESDVALAAAVDVAAPGRRAAVLRRARSPRVAAAIRRADANARSFDVRAPALLLDAGSGPLARVALSSDEDARAVVRRVGRILRR